MKYFLIAGEASGDSHASRLIEEIKKLDPNASFQFWGGDKMAQVTGSPPLKHFNELAFMGFVEVILNLKTILSNLKKVKKDILDFQPDRIIFIDYPGFNLRVVKWAKKKHFHTSYYISPTVWAWKPNRKETIRNGVDVMMVILPFEKAWYGQHGIPVHYVGNPVVEQVKAFQKNENFSTSFGLQHKVLALLPGSRKQEILAILPVMLETVKQLNANYDIVIAKPAFVPHSIYEPILSAQKDLRIKLIENEFYNILSVADMALVASGTATLETALFDVPQVVCYKTSYLNYAIASRLVKLKYISLVNLICNEELVKEMIQDDFTSDGALEQLQKLQYVDRKTLYAPLKKLLETQESPAATCAQLVVKG